MEESKELIFYWYTPSQGSRTAKAVLDICKVPYKAEIIDLSKGEQRSEAFLKVNPAGYLPAIVEEDFCLGETNAIIKYICTTRSGAPEHFYPKDPQQRAYCD
mmetsp:Transcript_5685/g.5189  ORF Transcript_5685/g.5189 Transcript_5685/m.5189 type:complete len:102 (-) Transcript_5685:445-750(-)